MDKIMIDRCVVEQALEALNASMPHNNDMDEDWPSHIAARRALRAVLEQPTRQPLTDEQIDTMFGNAEIGDALAERVRKRNQEIYWFGVRDAEAAHGIGA